MTGEQRVVRVPLYALLVMVAVAVLSPILTLLAAVSISARSLAASETKFCTLVTTLDHSYRQQPPTTPTGQTVAAGIAQLRAELRCPVVR